MQRILQSDSSVVSSPAVNRSVPASPSLHHGQVTPQLTPTVLSVSLKEKSLAIDQGGYLDHDFSENCPPIILAHSHPQEVLTVPPSSPQLRFAAIFLLIISLIGLIVLIYFESR